MVKVRLRLELTLLFCLVVGEPYSTDQKHTFSLILREFSQFYESCFYIGVKLDLLVWGVRIHSYKTCLNTMDFHLYSSN